MIKVLHIVEAFGGGVYTMVKSLTEGTCDRFDVTIAYSWRPQTPRDFREKMDPRIHLIELKHFGREIRPIKEAEAIMEAKRLVEEVKPDIIHLHSSKAGVVGRLAIDCKKYPVLYTPHGYSFIKKDEHSLKRHIYREIERFASMKGGLTVACSKGELALAESVTLNAIYINNGVDISKIPTRTAVGESGFDDVLEGKRRLRVCSLGRVCAQKNPELFNRIALAFPNIEFTWIGDGSDEDKALLTSENITVTGWKEPDEAKRLASTQDVLLLPSLWEGLSVSLLESMYMGLVCIGSTIPGTMDVINDEETGLLASRYKDYVKIFKKLLSGGYDTGTITRAARHEVEHHYTIERMCQKYSELYTEEAAG